MKNLKIKKQYIGSKVKSIAGGRWFLIEEGNEQLYWNAGLIEIFEQEKPAIIKVKKNAKDRTVPAESIDSNSERANDNTSPSLPV